MIFFSVAVSDGSSDASHIFEKGFHCKSAAIIREDILLDTQPLEYENFFDDVEDDPTKTKEADK